MNEKSLPSHEPRSNGQDMQPHSNQPGFLVVGIGASAGGIGALKQFFTAMPAQSGMAFVVILHLSDQHESILAHIIQTHTAMPVAQVTETVKVEPNHVYVIPPAKHLELLDGLIKLKEPDHIKGNRVPIDWFFRSLADAYGKDAVSIILSGTGSDGTLGMKRVKEFGGFVFAQSPEDAEYDGMPRSAIDTGLVDMVLPVAEIPGKLMRLGRLAEQIEIPDEQKAEPEKVAEKSARKIEPDALREVLTLLRVRTGHDFMNYKRPTLLRRISRRLQVRELEDIPAYLVLLRENPDEVQQLLRDLLITVTNFFRDQEAFAALEKEVIPQLFVGKTQADTIRVWVAGSATGEEAYSVGMLLCEHAARITDAPKIQIFASDINEEAIRSARDCRYDEVIVADVSPERLRRFFDKEGNTYCVKKELREMVLFAPHNLLRDPPFSRLDLVTCRNLLIYFNRETQDRVLEIFNFALRNNGFLFLGSSETAESQTALFTAVDKKQRIYRCRPGLAHHPLPAMPIQGKWVVKIPEAQADEYEPEGSFAATHLKLVEQYAPPSVLVNEDYDIVHSSEHAGRFLRFAGGEPSRNLLKLAHPALQLDLRSTLMAAKQAGAPSEARRIRVKLEGAERLVNLIVRPSDAGFLLVIFEEEKDAPAAREEGFIADAFAGEKAMETVVQGLEEELQTTKDRLRSTLEQSETSTEELKASNEELQAINEELRSASEELETSKEEMQSVNEELTTVNHELKSKVDEASHANSDLQNLMQSTDIGTIFLDRALQIKRFTPRAAELFNVIPADIGRPIEHITNKLNYGFLVEDAAQVLATLRPKEREMRGGKDDSRYLARLAPYRTLDDRIDGVVLSFQDITKLKRAADDLQSSEDNLRAIFSQAMAGIAQTDLTGKYLLVNDRFCELTGYAREELMQMHLQDLRHEEDLVGKQGLFERVLMTGEALVMEKRYRRKDGSSVWVSNSISLVRDVKNQPVSVLAFSLDISDRKAAEDAVRESEEKFRNLANSISQFAWITDAAGYIFWYNERWFDYTGTTLEEMQGWGWQTVHHPDEINRVLEKFKRHIASGEAWEDTFPLRSKDGEYRSFLSRASPIRDANGNVVRWFGTNTDIEDVRRAEEALKDADRRKDEFLATLAHELRNPLAAIRPALEIMRHGDEEKGAMARQVIERQIGQLVRLVDDLMDVSRITQGKINLQIEHVELAAAVTLALETIRPLADAARLELTVALPAEPLYLDADLTRLTQVFLNLLTNSVRYTQPGGSIWLTAAREGAQVVIRIKDTGIGIAPETLPHVFNLFSQGVRASHRAQGLGIGLSLVKQLAEMHGGAVTAYSAGTNRGSEFVMRLPLAADQQLALVVAASPPMATNATACRVLVVDDNADSVEMMDTLLTLEGHEVRRAYDGATAIRVALEYQPELMFLDLGLPDMDGYEVATRLREQLPHTLIVALSGWGQPSDRQRTREAGFNHHLVKPLDFAKLPELLSAARLQRQAKEAETSETI